MLELGAKVMIFFIISRFLPYFFSHTCHKIQFPCEHEEIIGKAVDILQYLGVYSLRFIEEKNPALSPAAHSAAHMGKGCLMATAENALALSEETIREVFDDVFKQIKDLEKQIAEVSKQMESDHDEKLIEKYARLEEEYKYAGGYTYHSEMLSVLNGFGFKEEDLDRKVSSFSGGEKTKIAFAGLLLSKPDLLLLDEPTNHLDLSTIEWLENYLAKRKSQAQQRGGDESV